MARDLYWQLFKSGQADLYNMELDTTKKIQMMYADAYKSIDSEVQGIYAKYAEGGKLTYTEMNKYQRYTSFNKEIDRILGNTLKKKDTAIMSHIEKTYKESFLKSAYATDMAGGSALQWGLFDNKAVEKVMTDPLSKLADSKALALDKKTSLYGIRKTITNGLIRGDTYKTMAKNIQDFMGVRDKNGVLRPLKKGEMYKAMRIVRTESNRAIVHGQMDEYQKSKELGLDVDAIWSAILSGDTRESHGAMDGKKRQEKGWYVPSIGWIPAPMQSGVASFDINCRCGVRTEVKDYPPEERYVRGDGVKPWCNYDEWKKEVTAKGSAKGVGGAVASASKGVGKIASILEAPVGKDGTGGTMRFKAKSGTSATDREHIAKAVSDAFNIDTMPKKALQALWKNHADISLAIIDEGPSRYRLLGNRIELSRADLATKVMSNTVRHEFGHALDWAKNSKFSTTKDFVDLVKRANNAIEANETVWQMMESYVTKNKSHPSLSDFFSALTKNEIVGDFWHPTIYYKTINTQSSEVFANMFDMYCDQKHWRFIEKHFTDLANSFKVYLGEIQ